MNKFILSLILALSLVRGYCQTVSRPTKVTIYEDGKKTYTITYTYDNRGNKTSLKGPGIPTITYTYDSKDRLLTESYTESGKLYKTTYTYSSTSSTSTVTRTGATSDQVTTTFMNGVPITIERTEGPITSSHHMRSTNIVWHDYSKGLKSYELIQFQYAGSNVWETQRRNIWTYTGNTSVQLTQFDGWQTRHNHNWYDEVRETIVRNEDGNITSLKNEFLETTNYTWRTEYASTSEYVGKNKVKEVFIRPAAQMITVTEFSGYLEFECKPNNETVLGVQDENPVSIISVYPNPSVGKVNVKSQNSPIEKVEIYNLSCVKVLEFEGNGEAIIQLDLSSLCSGVYVVKTYTEGPSVMSKLTLNN